MPDERTCPHTLAGNANHCEVCLRAENKWLTREITERDKRIATATELLEQGRARKHVYCALHGHSYERSFENGTVCTCCGVSREVTG
jgi:hypothetical protein